MDRQQPGIPKLPSTRSILRALVLLGALLRLYQLGAWGLWYDEANTLYAAALTATPAALLDVNQVTDAPLFSVLVWFWQQALRIAPIRPGSAVHDAALRLLPCLFSVLTISLTFAAGRRLLKRDAPALIAAFLVTISPFQVYYAQELRNYSLHAVLLLGALIFAARGVERGRTADWAGLAGCLSLAIWNHFYTLWYLPFFSVAFLLTFPWRRDRFLGWTAANAAAILLAAPAILMAFRIDAIVGQIASQWYPELTSATGFITFKNFFAGYTPHRLAYWPLFVMAGVFCAVGAGSLRKRPHALAFLAVLAAGPIAGSVALWSLRDFSFYQHRLFIFSGLAAALLAAQGIALLRQRWARTAVLGAWIALTVVPLADHYAQHLHPLPTHRLGVRLRAANRAAAHALAAMAVHFSHVTLPSFRHYTGPDVKHIHGAFTHWDVEGFLAAYPHPAIWEALDMMPTRLDAAIRPGYPLWFVESWWEPFQPPPEAALYRTYFDQQFLRIESRVFFAVSCFLYDADPARNLTARRSRLADYGAWQAPFYALSDGERLRPPSQIAPSAHSDQKPGGFGVRFVESGAALPISAAFDDGRVHADVVVDGGPTPREALVRTELSAARIDALRFRRETPETDAWLPWRRHDPALGGPNSLPAFVARLDRERTEGALYADAMLPEGTFDVYVSLMQAPEPVNTSSGLLRLSLHRHDGPDVPELVSTLDPSAPDAETGWFWRRAGTVSLTEGPHRLRVAASNPDALEQAWVNFGGVAFVPVEASGGADPLPPFDEQRILLGAGESGAVRCAAAWPPDAPLRLDVVVETPGDPEMRHIFADFGSTETHVNQTPREDAP